jgi:hypothetical protein
VLRSPVETTVEGRSCACARSDCLALITGKASGYSRPMILLLALVVLSGEAPAVAPKPWSLEDYATRPPREVAARALEPIIAEVWQRRTNVSLTFFLTPRVATDGLCSSSTFTVGPGFNALGGGDVYFKYLGPSPELSGSATFDHTATETACKALSSTSGFFLADSYDTAATAARRFLKLRGQARDASKPLPNMTIEGPLGPREARALLARLSLDDVRRVRLTGETPPFDVTIQFREISDPTGGANLSIVLKDEAHPSPIRIQYECCFVH